MRRLQRLSLEAKGKETCNPLYRLYDTVPWWRVLWVTIVILCARACPSFPLKNSMYRSLGMHIGDHTAIAFYVMMDLLHPEWITIGKNCVIGYNTTILTHEYLIDEYRFGHVNLGDEVMVGANVTILAGVSIGRRAVIGAGSVVTGDIPDGAFVVGVPARVIEH